MIIKGFFVGIAVFCCVMAASDAGWCGDNGTVTINGLVVLKDASCLGARTWEEAKSVTAALSESTAPAACNLKDGSKPGQWHLPYISSLRTICSQKGQLTNVRSGIYWSYNPSPVPPGAYSIMSTQFPGCYDINPRPFNSVNIIAVRNP